ncbi:MULTISPECIES: type II toxin-antitoxin system RelE family toxin [Chromobacterium]|uniref:Type II toxin-antitoxin system RelE/ParE family toxin n=1 Tax=Chromobacterium phragmitis TaxID=2202141 RepID=A0ABV0J132_9NEIS|nr:type II toxin-antitoxin system RelE/ParE family toxin [Chromobacterium sp. ASV23]
MNSISWTLKAAKQLRKLDKQDQQAIVGAVGGLTAMPDCRNIKALSNHEYGYRLRVGNYRVLFDWSGSLKIVEIQEVKKRDERTY